ncbi:MAG: glutaminase A [Kurthia sp.]|nr:glutaminase A [Candidatus Kurthia equi]
MSRLQQYVEESKPLAKLGKPVDYIPALSKQPVDQFTVCILDESGNQFLSGNTKGKFTLQSISKIISFIYICEHLGIEKVLEYVDMEPTGDAFNSMVRLEITEVGKPFNPLINAGAIAVCSLLPGAKKEERKEGLWQFIERMMGEKVAINEEVYRSELATAYRNRAIAYYLKSKNFLKGDVEDAVDIYTQQCAIIVDVEILARIALIIVNDGVNPTSGERIFSKKIAKIAKALLITCGMYNDSGKFAAFVGIPAKSGVSGGILTMANHANMEGLHGKLGIATFGPSIDDVGNSIVGMSFLKRLSEGFHLTIF